MKKRILIIAAFLILLTGCSTKDNKGYTVIWRRYDDSFQSGFRIIMEQEAQTRGINVVMQDGEDDPIKISNKMDAEISKGTNGFGLVSPDRESIAGFAEKAKENNIPVVFFNMEPSAETLQNYDKSWYVGAPAKDSGAMSAKVLIDYWKDNKEIADKNGDDVLQVAILQGEIGSQDVILRTEAYKEAFDAAGIKYEIVAIDTANWSKSEAMDKLSVWTSSIGLENIEGVLANNDNMALGALESVINSGYNQGDKQKFVPIVGIDATIEALQQMKNGALLGTVLNDRRGQSIAVLDIFDALSKDKEITKDIFSGEVELDGKYVWVPYIIVDGSNLDEIIKEVSDGSN